VVAVEARRDRDGRACRRQLAIAEP
jgi:hypothetical protein